jgi:hypothetical protein
MGFRRTRHNRRRKSRQRRRRRRTRGRRARSKRGGMNIRITDKMIANWQNPHNLSNDCCPCVFSLLGMPHKISNALATMNMGGMSPATMIQLFNQYYPNYTFTSPSIPITLQTPLRTILNDLYAVIPAGQATVGGFYRHAGMGHCIIWAKSLGGQPILLDAQAGQFYRGAKPILTYLLQQDAGSIVLIQGVSKINGTPLSINNQDGHTVQSIQQNHTQHHVPTSTPAQRQIDGIDDDPDL